MAGNATRHADRRVPDRAAHEGRDRGRARGPGADDARARDAGAGPARGPRRHRRDRRRARTFNVSTTAALIAAGAGLRAWPSTATARRPGSSGSADVLEALGARHRRPRPRASRSRIDEAGFGFMFAPAHHAATRFVVPGPQELGGAHDLQPARPADEPRGRAAPGRRRRRPRRPLELVAGALARLGTDRALVVSSADGLDELSTSRPDARGRGRGRAADAVRRRARAVGLGRGAPEDVAGGTPRGERRDARAILAGEPGPRAPISRCSTPAPRSTPAVAPTRSPRASSMRARGDRRRRGAAPRSTRYVALSQRAGAAPR